MKHSMIRGLAWAFSSLTLLTMVVPAPAMAARAPISTWELQDVATRLKGLDALLAEHWEYVLKDSPEFATILGDERYNDKWSDNSLAHAQGQMQSLQYFLARFEGVDTRDFTDAQRLNKSLMTRQLQDNIKALELKLYEMPLDQFNGAHLTYPQFVAVIPTSTVKHYEDYLKRLHGIPHQLDDLIEMSREGMKDGLMPPKFLLEKVVTQCQAIAKPAGLESPFAQPLMKFPDSIPAEDQARLRAAIIAAIDNEVRPAYVKLAEFVAKDYAPNGRTQPGIWSLPNGREIYEFAIQTQTTTIMPADAIHELGLAEVKRIEGEQLVIAKKLGYKDLKSFRVALKADPKTHATSRQQMVDLYKQYIAQMQKQLPKLFGLLPKTQVQVMAVEEYREKEASGASYQQGTPDGSRPGLIYVNTGDFQDRSLLTIESTAYHEGVPGHHMQIAIAQTLPELPAFRQQGGYTAYVEGWALYSERLGKEVGFYKDPYSDYGRLSDELLRANRLVLDTGVHYKHWTREQMVDWFHEHSSDDEPDLQSETDRYIAVPGQALAYKLGQLKILELREGAKKVLGKRFDIRAFHDAVLGGGALPLDVLEGQINGWVRDTLSKAG